MSRILNIGAAQLGPIQRSDTRKNVVERMCELLKQAKKKNCDVVVFPELCLTTFFPRWFFEDSSEVDNFFETEMPNKECKPLFDLGQKLGILFSFGFAELIKVGKDTKRFNTSIIVNTKGEIELKYRKIHLPGHSEFDEKRSFQHLEKRYFDIGDLGFPVSRIMNVNMGMCICNDRRWSETYRVMGLQDVELIMLGYNTPLQNPPAPEHDHLTSFHNHLSMQAGAYQNATWVVGVAKAGIEEGVHHLGQSSIISPSGEIVSMATTIDDELITASCNFDLCRSYKETWFNFEKHRQPQHYHLITDRIGAIPPEK
ncbi:MAG: N-carbamoyl-D-amino-acid hydrolase [Rhodospirillaceae bacterium]|nr:N-carbamoyl-D-amino-acid hydrolase [Rhodospirillaceae bacterium]|tara:strand:+ start:5015 stop:5953 length:939 start_codon:yes stop_codon:yes gene_type:complete